MSETAKRRQEDEDGELETKRPTLENNDDNTTTADNNTATSTDSSSATATSAAPAEQTTEASSSTPSADKPATSEEQPAMDSTTTAAPATTAAQPTDAMNNGALPLADGQIEEIIDVADDQVGRLIGSGGSNIKQLEAFSGAQINIPQDCLPGTKVRRVSIRGAPECVQKCKEQLEVKIREDGGDPMNANLEKVKVVHYVPNEHVGRVIGRGGSTIRHIQDLSGAHMDIAKECRPGQNVREVEITGTGEQIESCKNFIDMKVRGESLPASTSRSANECIITIPDDMVGRIIGKGGQTIRELQDQSGAHMDVAKAPNPGTNRREIVLRNQPQQIAYCTYLINTKIAEITGDYTRNFVEGPDDVLTAAANMGAMHAQLRQQQQMMQYYPQPQGGQQPQQMQQMQPQQMQQGGQQQQYYNPYQYYQQPAQGQGQQQMYAQYGQQAQQQPQQQQYQQYYQQQ